MCVKQLRLWFEPLIPRICAFPYLRAALVPGLTRTAWDGYIQQGDSRRDRVAFRWANTEDKQLIDSLESFKTVAVYGTSSLNGTIQLRGLPGESMDKLQQHGNPDAIFEVVDVGEGLCPKNNQAGMNYIDIFTGIGEAEAAFNDTWLFFSKPVQVYTISSGN